jgi:hypothetical protein
MRRLTIVLMALTTTAACAGPKPALSFGGKAVPVNVSFGKPGPDDPRAPTVPFVLGPVLGGAGVVPVASPPHKGRAALTPDPLPLAPVETCPAADPTDVNAQPRTEAGRDLGPAPNAQTIGYRVDGRFLGTAFSGVIERGIVHPTTAANGNTAFSVESTALGVKTTADYAGTQPAGQVPGSVGLSGITADGRGIDARPSFHAPKPVTLMPLPATLAATWNDATVDPLTATTYKVSGTVVGKSRVDACGQFVDAWQVTISQDVDTPFQQIHSEITDWIATQYGGLIVKESVSWSGLAGTQQVAGDYTATVDKDPGA